VNSIDRYQYLLVLAACVLITLPLEFAFGARVWRRPARLARAIGPILLVYLPWDVWKTQRGVWFFDERYVVGIDLPGGIPIEELLFFIVIPTCALLTIESVRNMRAGVTPIQRRLADRTFAGHVRQDRT
jgi:lycopene cyclase domain-containing protein